MSIPIFICRASEGDSLSTNYLISLHPLQMFANGIKVEVERRLPNSHFSIGVSPEFYFGAIDDARDNLLVSANKDTVEVLGFGICVNARAYVSNNPKFGGLQNPVSNFYLFGALEFRSFGLDYTGKAWTLEQENGIEIYRLRNTQIHNSIIRVNVNLGIGNTIFFGNDLFMDLFAYTRVSKAYDNPNKLDNISYR
ncbi:MAG: hypothetical protein HYZ54_10410 [Ignavibacteriae bacterium]|nr:hypothetical protein [Ignavibacteriota bacterium]